MAEKINLCFEKSILTYNSILNFGKYKGEKASWVLFTEPSYITFMIEKLDYVLEGELLEKYEEHLGLVYLFERSKVIQELAEKELENWDIKMIGVETDD